MLKRLASSFLLAIHNIRSHFFHTVLSVLGIVIGVAALVAILSLIDGAEKFAKEQIATTTSLNAVVVYSQPYKVINEVKVKKDTVSVLNYDRFIAATQRLSKPAEKEFYASSADQVSLIGHPDVIGTKILMTGVGATPDLQMETGTYLTTDHVEQQAAVVVVNRAFALAIHRTANELIGKEVKWKDRQLRIVGVMKEDKNKSPLIIFPITLLTAHELNNNPPSLVLKATSVEDVPVLKEEITTWLEKEFATAKDDFKVITNELRVKQAAQGFLLFRVVMGMIVGISVLVGGIGVMNVLLISVTERTVEIGIRKAVGANRRDIVLQFLAESITVSAFGSFLGLVVGILGTMVMVPIIKAITKVPFQAEYTLNTLIVISIIALAVGIIFGTYPALRASRLDPVEAIRRE